MTIYFWCRDWGFLTVNCPILFLLTRKSWNWMSSTLHLAASDLSSSEGESIMIMHLSEGHWSALANKFLVFCVESQTTYLMSPWEKTPKSIISQPQICIATIPHIKGLLNLLDFTPVYYFEFWFPLALKMGKGCFEQTQGLLILGCLHKLLHLSIPVLYFLTVFYQCYFLITLLSKEIISTNIWTLFT